MEFERRVLFESVAECGELFFRKVRPDLFQEASGDGQNSGQNLDLIRNHGQGSLWPQFPCQLSRSQRKLLGVIAQPQQVLGLRVLGKRALHLLEQDFECSGEILRAFCEGIPGGGVGQPTETRGQIDRGTLEHPRLFPMHHGRGMLLFFTN